MPKGLIVHCVIFNNKKEILILKRSSEEDVFPDLWDIPGGTLEDGEDPEVGVKREIKEETGLDIKEMSLFYSMSNIDTTKNKQFIRLEFIAQYDEVGTVILNPKEHQEYQWVSLSDFKNFDCVPYMYTIAGSIENHVLLKLSRLNV